ncbi:MAG: chemotaxis protein CheD [Methylophilales bacterium RIFCSPHIGHO2_02_FULL_57_10]|nr:MAG: chemotaxis protein CheD [Methylophilales bacterium RIFCSPHIGHO2_02_FULL_57_10]
MSTHAYEEVMAPNLYYDRTHDIDAAKILPGEFYATQRDMVLVTVLGSCVAACIRDSVNGIGGMNHYMLPDSPGDQGESGRYGTYAMEILINHLMKLGAQRKNLEAKVFGGGNVIATMTTTNVGERNAKFVLDFLKTEQIRVAAKDLLDIYPRKVYFFPYTGKVLVKKLRNLHNDTIIERETEYTKRLRIDKMEGDIELFT